MDWTETESETDTEASSISSISDDDDCDVEKLTSEIQKETELIVYGQKINISEAPDSSLQNPNENDGSRKGDIKNEQEDSMDATPSPSPSMKIQIIGGKLNLR